MRILIVSDTHGRQEHLRQILPKVEPDEVWHLGDSEGYTNEIAQMAGVPCSFVAGNCDMFGASYLSDFMIKEVGKHRVYMCHGHKDSVKYGLDALAAVAKAQGCDIALFGHTHVPTYEEVKGITVVNPGSISLPRQDGRVPTYAVMNVDDDGEVRIGIVYKDW